MSHDNAHIFLSYRSTEADFALQLAADLKNAGVNLWMDRLDIKPGDDWRLTLEAAVYSSAAVIAVLSPEYVASRYCRRELSRADRLGRRIYPVLLHPLLEKEWPLEIERQQYVDFSHWNDHLHYQNQLTCLVDVLRDQFSEQISMEPPIAEVQYLNNLAAELETRKGITEYLEHSTPADQWFSREFVPPEPRHSNTWTGPTTFIVYPQIGLRILPTRLSEQTN